MALPSNINQTDFSAHTFIYAHPFHQNTISLLLIFLFSYGSPCFSLFHIKNQKFSNFPTTRFVNLFNSFTLNSLSNFVLFFKRVKFFNSKILFIIIVNVYYVMGFRPFRPNYFTCTAHLYLYCTLLVPHTYASYLYKALMYIFSLRNTIQSSSISNMVSEPLL